MNIMLSSDNFEDQLQEEYGKIFNNISYFRARKQKYRFHERGNSECGKNPCLETSYKVDEAKPELLGDKAVQSECGKNPCSATCYKVDEGNTELLGDKAVQSECGKNQCSATSYKVDEGSAELLGDKAVQSECGKNPCSDTCYKVDEGSEELLGDKAVQTIDRTTAQKDKYRRFKTQLHRQKEHQNGVNPPPNEPKNCSLYEKIAMDLETVFNKYMMVNQDPGSEECFKGEKNAETTMDVRNVANITEHEKAMLRNEITYKTVQTKNDTLYIWTAHV